MSVVSIGAAKCAASAKKVVHLKGPRELSDAFNGPKCVILLHHPTCHYCIAFSPVYAAAAAEHPNATFYALDVTLAEPQKDMPKLNFFTDNGVPRVAVAGRGEVVETVKGNDSERFAQMLRKLIDV
jgi:thiol-disulfide isomerase/thioredoxin